MNRMHEVNRKHWNEQFAQEFQAQDNETGLWRRCPEEPDLAFDCAVLDLIQGFVEDLSGKDVCVVGSGDNHAAFALAGLGAKVTSVDLSSAQLDVAAARSEELGLSIAFLESDATDLACLEGNTFDLVCSSNGFFIWISSLDSLFSELHRILRANGFYVFYDIHPFLRPWEDDLEIRMKKPYFDLGPSRDSEDDPYFFFWTMADLMNTLADTGFFIRKVVESPAKDSSFWEGEKWYLPGNQPHLLNWRVNPRAGLPVWLMVAAQKLDYIG